MMMSTEQFFSVINDRINEMVEKKMLARANNALVPIDRKAIQQECENEFFKGLEQSVANSSETCKTFYDFLRIDNPELYSVVTERLNNIHIETVEDLLNLSTFKPEEKILVKVKEAGFNFLNAGDDQRAFHYFAYLSLVDSHNPQVWFLKAMAEHNLGKFDDALASYDRAISFAPKYIAAFIHRINCFIAANRLQEAKQAYDAFLLEFDSSEYKGNQFVDTNLEKIKQALSGVK